MYYVSKGSHNDGFYVVNTEIMHEEHKTLGEFCDIIENGALIPNDGRGEVVITDIGGRPLTVQDLRNVDVVTCVMSRIMDDIVIASTGDGAMKAQYGIYNYSDSWRANRLCCFGHGVTIIGNGTTTYVHCGERIYRIEGIGSILGIFFDDNEGLTLRCSKLTRVWEMPLCGGIGESYTRFGVAVGVMNGSVNFMKRMALL